LLGWHCIYLDSAGLEEPYAWMLNMASSLEHHQQSKSFDWMYVVKNQDIHPTIIHFSARCGR
jgi:hypothetical protein